MRYATDVLPRENPRIDRCQDTASRFGSAVAAKEADSEVREVDRTTTVSKILLAYDGSEAASDAAHVAAGMALRHGAKVIVLKVGRIMEVLDAVLYPTMEEEVHYWIAEMGAGLIRDLGGVAEARMEWGEPAEKIVELAEQERVDLIIVGHNPLSGLRRLLHGRSTASKVMDHASCPVLVVRQSKDLLDGDALDEKGLNG